MMLSRFVSIACGLLMAANSLAGNDKSLSETARLAASGTRVLTGADLATRPATTTIFHPIDWELPRGTEPINGSQPRTSGVNLFRGQASPQVSLAVLPARGGLVPELTLSYSAQSGDTMLGSGWQFGFMSSVERRAVGGGTPDMYGVLDDPSDEFEFRIDGTKLVPNPANDGTYRSEHDAFTVIEPKVHWALVNRVVGWEVRRNGITRTYGSAENTGFCQQGVEYATADCIEPVRWYLTRIEDAHGNAVDIEYESFNRSAGTLTPEETIADVLTARTTRLLNERFAGEIPTVPRARDATSSKRKRASKTRQARATNPVDPTTDLTTRTNTDTVFANAIERTIIGSDTNQLLPTRMSYNGGSHTISLSYENRPDVRSERRDGIERTLIKRVARIDVEAVRDGVEHLAYRYHFDYQSAAADGRSLLTAIRQESVDASSGEPAPTVLLKRFEYDDQELSDLSWEDWQALDVTGMPMVPADYEFSDEMQTHAYSSSSVLVNVDTDAQPDLIVLNTDCEADPPEPPEDRDPGGGEGPRDDGGGGIDIVELPRTALAGCKSHHRVYLNEANGSDSRKFVYDSVRSDQLNERLGPLQQSSGPVDYLIVDIDGNGIADLVLGDVDNGTGDLADDQRFFAGSQQGWRGTGVAIPWAGTLDGHDPFRELQIADINGDGKPDLVGDEKYYVNSGAAPFFTSAAAKSLQLYASDGDLRNLPADLPVTPEDDCMARNAGPRFARGDLGIHRGFSSDAYRGTENVNDAIDAAQWVWRHTSYGDFNGDGVADRVVALSWPEEGLIVRDIGSTAIWQDSGGRCGGVNTVYIGNGRGQFFQTDATIGGLYAWQGGPRAMDVSRNEVRTAPAVTFEYNPPVNQQALVDLDGDGREEMLQVCGTGWAHAIADVGDEEGFGLSANSTNCPAGTLSLPAMWNGSGASLPPFVGTRDDSVLGGYFDIDSDGLTDIFVAANPVNPNDTSKAGGDRPYWRRNVRAVPQSRLTAIVGPRGGRSEFYWSSVSDGGLDGARQLPVIGAIDDMSGRTDFRFSSPAFEDGRFLGFQHAEAWGTSGIVQVTQFSTDRRRLGAIEYEATHTETGALHRLTVHLDRTDAESAYLDPDAPFFNAVYRTCTFEFENDSTESDPSSFIQECSEFDGQEGPRTLSDIVLGHRSAKALRSRKERRASADASRTVLPGDLEAGDEVIQESPVDTGPSPIFLTDNRMRVTEFDWDELTGVLLEEHAFKDVTTTDDTTVSTFTYHPWDEALAVRRLHTRKTTDVGDGSVAAQTSGAERTKASRQRSSARAGAIAAEHRADEAQLRISARGLRRNRMGARDPAGVCVCAGHASTGGAGPAERQSLANAHLQSGCCRARDRLGRGARRVLCDRSLRPDFPAQHCNRLGIHRARCDLSRDSQGDESRPARAANVRWLQPSDQPGRRYHPSGCCAAAQRHCTFRLRPGRRIDCARDGRDQARCFRHRNPGQGLRGRAWSKLETSGLRASLRLDG